MARAFQLQKNQDLLKAFNFALHQYKLEFNVTPNQHFASVLGFKTSSQFINLLQPYNEKFIKVDELFLCMDNLGNHTKPILDFICDKYGYVCTPKADSANCSLDNVKDSLLSISATNGAVVNSFISGNEDNHYDEDEINDTLNLIQKERSQLVCLEDKLKAMKKALKNG